MFGRRANVLTSSHASLARRHSSASDQRSTGRRARQAMPTLGRSGGIRDDAVLRILVAGISITLDAMADGRYWPATSGPSRRPCRARRPRRCRRCPRGVGRRGFPSSCPRRGSRRPAGCGATECGNRSRPRRGRRIRPPAPRRGVETVQASLLPLFQRNLSPSSAMRNRVGPRCRRRRNTASNGRLALIENLADTAAPQEVHRQSLRLGIGRHVWPPAGSSAGGSFGASSFAFVRLLRLLRRLVLR